MSFRLDTVKKWKKVSDREKEHTETTSDVIDWLINEVDRLTSQPQSAMSPEEWHEMAATKLATHNRQVLQEFLAQAQGDSESALRDTFAASALTGLLASGIDDGLTPVSEIAKVSYVYANRMLKAREDAIKR